MSDPYLGEIRIFAGTFAPKGWALCQGQTLSLGSYTALFSLLGTTYGGNGTSNFALPNLTGRAALQQGETNGLTARTLGQKGGEAAVTLTVQQLPGHTHNMLAAAAPKTGQANVPGPTACMGSGVTGDKIYGAASGGNAMNAAGLTSVGGGQAHNNMDPYIVMTYIIATTGVFPTRD
jgi:microcystin-dependent protein